MKKLIIAGLVLLKLSTVSNAETAPNFTVTDIHGVTHTLSKYTDNGKYVLIDLFATWCGPCKTTAPNLSKIFHTYGENERQLVVLGISVDSDDTKSKIETFEATYGGDYEYPTVAGADGGAGVSSAYYSAGIYEGYIPTIILIEANTREVLYAQSGGKTEQGFLDLLNTHNIPNYPVAAQFINNGGTISTMIIESMTSENIRLNVKNVSQGQLKLFSINGRILFDKSVALKKGYNNIEWDGKSFANQIVTLKVNTKKLNEVRSFVIK